MFASVHEFECQKRKKEPVKDSGSFIFKKEGRLLSQADVVNDSRIVDVELKLPAISSTTMIL